MIKCYLDDKTLLVQFTTTELDHHVANYIRENVDDIIMRKNIKNIIFDFTPLFLGSWLPSCEDCTNKSLGDRVSVMSIV